MSSATTTTTNSRPKVPPLSRAICGLFYGKAVDASSTLWKCKCGVERKCDVKNNGCNNLITYLKSKHPDYLEIYAAHTLESSSSKSSQANQKGQQTTLEYLIDSKSRNVYKWLDWIVMDEHVLSFCEKDRTRENTNFGKICSKTLKKYMFLLVAAVEKRSQQKLQSRHAMP